MKINIYYGGRGLVDDPTIYVIEKLSRVFDELHVAVERYNLFEEKSNVMVLPKTLKDADGVILAASVEWFGIGGLLQQFLDACWLYGDKENIAHIYMLPVVLATTYGEREAEYSLIRAWEMIGGVPCEGMCAYVNDPVEFETNPEYNLMIEKVAENFYRAMSKRTLAFPNSSYQVKKKVLRSSSLPLTPQESEQLSVYVSNDDYVRRQKEDIDELASQFKGMIGDEPPEADYTDIMKNHFYPIDDLRAVFRLDLVDENTTLVIDVNDDRLTFMKYPLGSAPSGIKADVVAKIRTAVLKEILEGEQSFQSAFMSGQAVAQGNFTKIRHFDAIFRFGDDDDDEDEEY